MQNKLIAPLITLVFLAACSETPPPPTEIDVNITIEEKTPPKPVIDTKDERGTIIGNEQRYTRP